MSFQNVSMFVLTLPKESDPNYKIANGNSDPGRGFGHICISVDNIQAACKRIEDAGYPFQKKLTDGRMRHIAFAKDPDGYWVEIIGQRPLEETEDVTTTETSSYRLNHSMIRVKSAVGYSVPSKHVSVLPRVVPV
jgi:lactoylglutathione lyase